MSLHTIRLVAFLAMALLALAVLDATGSLAWFAVVGVGALVVGALVDRVFRRVASPEEVRRDLEDRVRNPPS